MLIKRTTVAFLTACLACCPLFLYGATVQNKQPFPLSVEENKDSVVRLFVVDSQDPNQVIQYGTGFFVENNRPDHVTLATVFHFFLIPFLTGDSFELVMEYKGKILSLKDEEVSFSSLQDTAFVHIAKEKFNLLSPAVKPLHIRKTPLKTEESLYTMGFLNGYFHKIRATRIKPHPQDPGDFSFILNRTQISGASGAPLMDREGKLTLILKKGYFNYGFGSEVSGFNELIQTAGCPASLRECVFDAGEELYQAGKAGNAKAQGLILQLGDACPYCFENFMRFVGVNDQAAMKKDRDFFEEGASKAYLSVLYPRIQKSEDLKETENFWRRGRSLARQGYPHIQHILCKALNDLGGTTFNERDELQCFQEPARGGFSQSQWIMAALSFRSDRGAALEWLEKAATQGHYKSCDIIQKLYTQQVDAVCSNERECNEVTRIYHTVEEICRGVQLASIPYTPEMKKRSLFSFSTSLSPRTSFGTEPKEGDDTVSISLSKPLSENDKFKVGYDNDDADDNSLSVFGSRHNK